MATPNLDDLEREIAAAGAANDGDWLGMVVKKEDRSGRQVVIPNISNAVTVLKHHPEWCGVLAWDQFSERVVMRKEPPWHHTVSPSTRWYETTGELRETDTARIIDWFARNVALEIKPQTIEQAVAVVAESAAFHPVREYLEGLEWDETPRLESWLADYCGVEWTEYSGAVGVRWMISAVARVVEPGCQVDTMLILEGAQGLYKSKAFRSLVPDPRFYSETGITIGDKDSYQALHGVWIYGLDELDSLKRGEVTKVKNFITSPKDHYRPSYGRVARDYARQNVFAGTTNETEYLLDRTGNRRFWPVRVRNPIDIDALVRDRDQLWAEAYVRFGCGERWYADTAELRALCEAEQADRVTADDWETIVGAWLARPTEASVDRDGHAGRDPVDVSQGVTTADVLRHALGFSADKIRKPDTMRAADVLRALGWTRGPLRMEDGQRVRRYVKVVQVDQEGGSPLNHEK